MVQTNTSLPGEDQALEEVLRGLRRDVDHLSRMNAVSRTPLFAIVLALRV